MSKPKVSPDPGHPTYVAAFERVIKTLEPLDDDARERIVLAACVLFSIPVEVVNARRR